MNKTIRLEVVSAEEEILAAEGTFVILPGEEGELVGHAESNVII